MNPVSSPGDPIFYMHHAWLDMLWAKWQDASPARLKEIGGNNKMAGGSGLLGATRPSDVP